MTAKTADQATLMLRRYRQHLVERGRYEAWGICRKEGTVHSRQVRDRLKSLGLLTPGVGERWLGAVFNACDLFEPVEGAAVAPKPNDQTNYHGGALVRVWRLTEAGKGAALKCPVWYSVVPVAPAPKKRPAPNKSAQPVQAEPQGENYMGITKLKAIRAEAEVLGQLREVGWSQETGGYVTGLSLDEFYEMLDKCKTGAVAAVRLHNPTPPEQRPIHVPGHNPPIPAVVPPAALEAMKPEPTPQAAPKPPESQTIAPKHDSAAESDAAEPAAPALENGPDVFDEAIAARKAQSDELPPALAKAGRMLDVVNYFVEQGVKDEAAIVAECERIKDKVPFLARTGNLASRVQRTLAAYHGTAA